MSSKTRYLFMLVALFLAACQEAPVVTGTALPTVTETREVVIAAATPTLPPSTPTSLLPSLTPSHTHMPTVPPHPTNTPTIQPSITPTSVPTLIPATPLPSPTNYTLKPWAEQDTWDVISLFNWEWEQYSQSNEWRIPDFEDNFARFHLYLAYFKKEILWRSPNSDRYSDTLWEIALDLALAGEQEASLRLLPLMEQELNAQNTDEPNVTFLNIRGFTFDLMAVENLFGDNQLAWILILSQEHSPFTNDVGAAFSIRQTAGGYSVALINSFWVPYLGNGFTVTVMEHTNDTFSEVIIERKTTSGTGPPSNYGSICVYQWNGTEWFSLLNSNGDKPCIGHWEDRANPFPIQYILDETANLEHIEIISTINPSTWPLCEWAYRAIFTWNEVQYAFEDIVFDIPSQFSHVDQLECLREVWEEPTSIGDAAKIVLYMEQVLTAWPATEDINEVTMWWFDDEYPWIFRFQLGRYYALTGDLAKAEPFLAEVAGQPLTNFEAPWPTMAQSYLNNLDDLDRAEQLLAEFNASLLPVWTSSTWVNVDEVSLELANRLFAGDDPQSIVTELETLIAGQCTENRYCGWPYYVLGLTYEAAGDEVNAVAAYWQVWHDYPNSYYATVAQYRLVEKE